MVTNLVIGESQHEAIEEQHFWPAVRASLDDGDAASGQHDQRGNTVNSSHIVNIARCRTAGEFRPAAITPGFPA